MKLSTLSPIAAVLITRCIAIPTPLQTPTNVSVSKDPSPPRPFPAGRIVEVKDPSPPRPFPKYRLIEGNPLEEMYPLALSRFSADGNGEGHDPSPPRPFHAGRIVEVKNSSSSLEEREPSAPHKLVKVQATSPDPSPPRPFPEYSVKGGVSLEERDPLSRLATNAGKEEADPSPPMPFPAGRLARPAERVEETTDPIPSDTITINARSPSPILRIAKGSEAEANDPSPPRPFLAGHAEEIDPRAEPLRPNRGHGGYFPPSNPPPVSEPTAQADVVVVEYVDDPCPDLCGHDERKPSTPPPPATMSTVDGNPPGIPSPTDTIFVYPIPPHGTPQYHPVPSRSTLVTTVVTRSSTLTTVVIRSSPSSIAVMSASSPSSISANSNSDSSPSPSSIIAPYHLPPHLGHLPPMPRLTPSPTLALTVASNNNNDNNSSLTINSTSHNSPPTPRCRRGRCSSVSMSISASYQG